MKLALITVAWLAWSWGWMIVLAAYENRHRE